MKTLQQLQEDIRAMYTEEMNLRIRTAEHDYNAGVTDCLQGQYDKFYRYNRDDDGAAYDLGWTTQNMETQNTAVEFLY